MLSLDKIWLATEPVDMRSGIDKLTEYVSQHLEQSWQSEAVFIFSNKSRTRLKLLKWDKHGVWLSVRRLHRGRFIWPKKGASCLTLTLEQFHWLMKGINWQQVEGERLLNWQ